MKNAKVKLTLLTKKAVLEPKWKGWAEPNFIPKNKLLTCSKQFIHFVRTEVYQHHPKIIICHLGVCIASSAYQKWPTSNPAFCVRLQIEQVGLLTYRSFSDPLQHVIKQIPGTV